MTARSKQEGEGAKAPTSGRKWRLDPPGGTGSIHLRAEFDSYEEALAVANAAYPPRTRIVELTDKGEPVLRPPPNPKQTYADLKIDIALVPSTSILREAEAMMEGARKYGPFNWREFPVESKTYLSASIRHILSYIDGENIDPECGVHHLGLAKACLGIVLDAEENDSLIDNRAKNGRAGELIRNFAAERRTKQNP